LLDDSPESNAFLFLVLRSLERWVDAAEYAQRIGELGGDQALSSFWSAQALAVIGHEDQAKQTLKVLIRDADMGGDIPFGGEYRISRREWNETLAIVLGVRGALEVEQGSPVLRTQVGSDRRAVSVGERRPTLLVQGVPRSGTSLVGRLFNCWKEVVVFHELFGPHADLYPQSFTTESLNDRILEGHLEGKRRRNAELFSRIDQALFRGDKNPLALLRLRRTLGHFEGSDLRVCIVLRRPDDVVASAARRASNPEDRWEMHHGATYMARLAYVMLEEVMSLAGSGSYEHQLVPLFYDDLVASPIDQMRQAALRCGVLSDPDLEEMGEVLMQGRSSAAGSSFGAGECEVTPQLAHTWEVLQSDFG